MVTAQDSGRMRVGEGARRGPEEAAEGAVDADVASSSSSNRTRIFRGVMVLVVGRHLKRREKRESGGWRWGGGGGREGEKLGQFFFLSSEKQRSWILKKIKKDY